MRAAAASLRCPVSRAHSAQRGCFGASSAVVCRSLWLCLMGAFEDRTPVSGKLIQCAQTPTNKPVADKAGSSSFAAGPTDDQEEGATGRGRGRGRGRAWDSTGQQQRQVVRDGGLGLAMGEVKSKECKRQERRGKATKPRRATDSPTFYH